MRKFIKINLIILVMFILISNYLILLKVDATSEIPEENKIQEENASETQDEKTIDELQLEKNDLENEIKESNEQIQFIESELSSTILEIAEINQKICDKQMEIETLEAQEIELLAYIDKAEKELEKSNEKYKKQKKLLERRLVAMYEMGKTSYLDLLLNAKGFSEFLSIYYFIEQISNADNELLEAVNAEQIYNQKLKDVLVEKNNILVESREIREKNSILLTNMSKIKNRRLNELSENEIELQKSIEEYQNKIAEIETEIRLLSIANIGSDYVGGVMAWPVPGYTRITSPFGMRTHPITGIYKLHTGTDIGAPYGSTFVAANDGIVTYAGVNTAYGNMVIVDHGGGITTLYAHGSEILVQVGDTVYQGTPVLRVGSTGYSTGPHAHFEVRVNGEYVNPLDYITSYSSSTETNDSKEKINVEFQTEKNEEEANEQ